MKKIYSVGIVMLVVSFLCGCSGQKQGEKGEPVADNLPVITVGCDNYSPFSYRDTNGNMTGIDVELAREAFSQMGYAPSLCLLIGRTRKNCWRMGRLTVSGAVLR